MIHILWCTLRPDTFIEMHSKWLSRANNPDNITTHVGVNSIEHQDKINSYLKDRDRCIITDTKGKIGVCLPSYLVSSTLTGEDSDIVVFASDDFLAPQDWDTYLINQLKDKEGALFVRDGYQLPDSSNMLFPAITIPIMTYGCLRKLNMAIYHPAYTHMFSDCELFMNVKDLGLLIDNRLTDTTTFEHLHYAAGKRQPDQADAAYNRYWAMDSFTWDARKDMPVSERLKVNI